MGIREVKCGELAIWICCWLARIFAPEAKLVGCSSQVITDNKVYSADV